MASETLGHSVPTLNSTTAVVLDADAGVAGIQATRNVSGIAPFSVDIQVDSIDALNLNPGKYNGYQWEIAFPTAGLVFAGGVVENSGTSGFSLCAPAVDSSNLTPDPTDTVIGGGAGCVTAGAALTYIARKACSTWASCL